jgi:hypothetical protein
MRFAITALMAAALGSLCAAPARAQVDLTGGDTLNSWVDLRLGGASGETSWTRGGFGKLRFGQGSAATQAEAGLEWQPRLSDTWRFHIVGQYDADAVNPFGVTESYLGWKPVPTSPVRYAFRFGRLLPPISLENEGPGWTPTRTLSSSAIDTWVGEELLVTGAEASVRTSVAGHGLAVTGGLFEGADAAGAILAYRGWALHDLVTAGNATMRLPDTPGAGYEAIFLKQARLTRPGVEVDGRAGYYLRGDWRPPAAVAVNLVYLYNPGDPSIVPRGQYGWTTRLLGGGVAYTPDPKDEVLGQYMWGSTKMGAIMPNGRHPADLIFESAYVLVSHRLDDGSRLTLRGDAFATRDHSLAHLYENAERGYATTAAWIRPWTDHLRSAVEILNLASRRGARLTVPEPEHQSQTQVQISLRISG